MDRRQRAVVSGVHGLQHVERLAAAADANSEHPIGRAIVAHAKEKGVAIRPVSSFRNLRGMGVRVTLDAAEVYAGSSTLLEERGASVPRELEEAVRMHEREGKTVVHVIRRGEWVGAVALADIIRNGSREAVGALKAMGLKVAMLTGDAEDVAAWVSKELGVKLPVVMGNKERESSEDVSLDDLVGDTEQLKDATVLSVDDELATAGTVLLSAIRVKEAFGANKVYSVVTHGIFCDPATARLSAPDCAIDRVYATDTIPVSMRPHLQPLVDSGRLVIIEWAKELPGMATDPRVHLTLSRPRRPE